jgi:hypothetical protein
MEHELQDFEGASPVDTTAQSLLAGDLGTPRLASQQRAGPCSMEHPQKYRHNRSVTTMIRNLSSSLSIGQHILR